MPALRASAGVRGGWAALRQGSSPGIRPDLLADRAPTEPARAGDCGEQAAAYQEQMTPQGSTDS